MAPKTWCMVLVLSLSSCAAATHGDAGDPNGDTVSAPAAGSGSVTVSGSAVGGSTGTGLSLGMIDPNAMPATPTTTAIARRPVVPCSGPCTDFPAAPVIDPKATTPVPANVAQIFSVAGGSGGPCVFEPEPSSLFPRNWLRPRVNFRPNAGDDVFEIRLHSDKESNDLVVYTTNVPWYMPKDWWTAVTAHVGEEWNFSLSVRSASSQSQDPPKKAPDVAFTIAPAEANGTLVYWTSTGVGSLKGFAVGDESVVDALDPAEVKQKTSTCIGCHTSTPDGKFAAFVVPEPKALTPPNQNTFTEALGSLQKADVGDVPAFLGTGARQFMDTAQTGLSAFSGAHWRDGDHVMVAQSGRGHAELFWIDLEATTPGQGTAYGMLKRDGDPRGAGAPTWTHDGSRIFYVSTNDAVDGRIDGTDTDVYSVPYADKQGGTATPLAGAAEGAFTEFYPAISGDDKLVVFNRVPNGVGLYNSPVAEVFVVPADGGTATRLTANDPPTCTHWPGPGPSNTWPKWSPEVQTVNGTTYYWLVFASTRNEDYRPQLHMTGVSIAAGSTQLTTHGAVQIWNQPDNESNHTPAWDVFKIPDTPPPTVVR